MTCSLGSVWNCGPERSSEDFLPLRASNTCTWAILLTHLPDPDDGVLAARHAAPDPELVVLGVHGDDLEVPHRNGLVSHLTRHLLSLEDASRVGGGPDRSRLPDVVRAVAHRTAPEAVALDGALEAAALGGRAHVYLVSDLEDVGAYRFADLARHAAQLLEMLARGRVDLLEGTSVRLVDAVGLHPPEADLNGVVAVLVGVAGGRAQVRLDLDDRDANERPVILEGLGHVLLASEYCRCHSSQVAFISMLTPAGRSSRCSESTVRGVGCWMSMRRLCVCSWKCSRESLSLKGPRITVYRLRFVGSGTGPNTKAPVRSAVSTIDRAVLSMTSWS